MNPFLLHEALNSVALSHDEGCDCTTCRATGGDEAALAEVMAQIAEMGR